MGFLTRNLQDVVGVGFLTRNLQDVTIQEVYKLYMTTNVKTQAMLKHSSLCLYHKFKHSDPLNQA